MKCSICRLIRKTFCAGGDLLECSWNVFAPLAVHLHQETCFSRFSVRLCLPAERPAADTLGSLVLGVGQTL